MSVISVQEQARLQTLDELAIWDTPPEQEFDDLTRLAAFICGTTVSLITLVGAEHQFFKSVRNFSGGITPREGSFCAHALEQGTTLIVPDATQDDRFALNPLVTSDPNIRFYAGALIRSEGQLIGSICVLDKEPHHLTAEQSEALESLARQASNLLDARLMARRNERLRLEAKTARERLQESMDAARIAAWFYDPARNVVGGDALMGKLFGLAIPEGPAELWIAAICQEDQAPVTAAFAESLAGAPYNIKFRVIVNGEVCWLHSRATLRGTLDGAIRMVGVCEDVTAMQNLLAELLETKERLSLAQEASGSVSFHWNFAEDIVSWGAPQAFGRPAVDVSTSADFFRYVIEDDREGFRLALAPAIANGHPYSYEFRMLWPDGSIHWVSTIGRGTPNAQGLVEALVGVNLDITARKIAEETLLQAQKLSAVGRLASVISHEINNPLEAVTNLLYIVRLSENLKQQDRDNLDLADRELARVSQITAQTLRFHRSLNNPGRIEASTMIEEMMILYQSRLTASQIEVRLDFGRNVTFDAFEGDIRQVLNNLIGNAFDAMRKGGRLTIRTRCSLGASTGQMGVSILVVDDGPGIPEEARAHVFEAFYSTKGINGTGLGLWISKRIVHKHQGHLRFRTSTGERHGTAFRMWIPILVAASAAEPWA